MNKMENTGSQLELTSLMTEYENQFDRSNKLDNKVYITITFCGFLFVFIIGLFNGISQLVKPEDGLQLFVSALYILSCIAVMGAYAYVLVFFMRLLQPEQIARMDPEIMQKEHLEEMEEEAASKEKELYDLKHELIASQIKLDNTEKSLRTLQQDQQESSRQIVRLETEIRGMKDKK